MNFSSMHAKTGPVTPLDALHALQSPNQFVAHPLPDRAGGSSFTVGVPEECGLRRHREHEHGNHDSGSGHHAHPAAAMVWAACTLAHRALAALTIARRPVTLRWCLRSGAGRCCLSASNFSASTFAHRKR